MRTIEIKKGNDLVFTDGHTEPLFWGEVKLYAHGRNKKEVLEELIAQAEKLILEIQNDTAHIV